MSEKTLNVYLPTDEAGRAVMAQVITNILGDGEVKKEKIVRVAIPRKGKVKEKKGGLPVIESDKKTDE